MYLHRTSTHTYDTNLHMCTEETVVALFRVAFLLKTTHTSSICTKYEKRLHGPSRVAQQYAWLDDGMLTYRVN